MYRSEGRQGPMGSGPMIKVKFPQFKSAVVAANRR